MSLFGRRNADKATIRELTERLRIAKLGNLDLVLKNTTQQRELESFDDFMGFLSQSVPDFEGYVLAHMESKEDNDS